MRKTTSSEPGDEGERTQINRGQPVADIVPEKAATPAWKKAPQPRLSLGDLCLSAEVLVDRNETR
jgi:hypothetical protein